MICNQVESTPPPCRLPSRGEVKGCSPTSQAQRKRGGKHSKRSRTRAPHRPRTLLEVRVPAELLRTRLIRTHQSPPRRAASAGAPQVHAAESVHGEGEETGMVEEGGGGPEPAATKLGQAAGARGPDHTFGVFHVTVAPRVLTHHHPLGYSPSSLSNTIVLRNEESFPGRSVLGSRRLDRSLWLRAAPGNGFETRGCPDYASMDQKPGRRTRRRHARLPSPSLRLSEMIQRNAAAERGELRPSDPSSDATKGSGGCSRSIPCESKKKEEEKKKKSDPTHTHTKSPSQNNEKRDKRGAACL